MADTGGRGVHFGLEIALAALDSVVEARGRARAAGA
jgi:hypothetical protein